MTKITVQKDKNFTVMSNYHLQDKTLSFKAKGLLSFMLSLPEDWDYTIAGIARYSKESVDSISSGIKELEKKGYVTRERVRNKDGKLGGSNYIVREKPFTESLNQTVPTSDYPTQEVPNQEKPIQEEPILENPVQVNPTLDLPSQQNTNLENTNLENTNIENTKDLLFCLLRARAADEKNTMLIKFIEAKTGIDELDKEDVKLIKQILTAANTPDKTELVVLAVENNLFRKLGFRMKYVSSTLMTWKRRNIVFPYQAKWDIHVDKWSNYMARTVEEVRKKHPHYNDDQVAEAVTNTASKNDIDYIYRTVVQAKEALKNGKHELYCKIVIGAREQGVPIDEYLPVKASS